jgi:hypothetical protein
MPAAGSAIRSTVSVIAGRGKQGFELVFQSGIGKPRRVFGSVRVAEEKRTEENAKPLDERTQPDATQKMQKSTKSQSELQTIRCF